MTTHAKNIGLLVGLGVLVHAGWWTVVLLTATDGPYLPFLDFPSFFYAADAVFNDGLSPYSADVIDSYSRELDQDVYPYLYPPGTLLALSPLSLLSYNQASLSFYFLNVAVIALLYYKLYTIFLADFRSRFWLLFCFAILIGSDAVTATLRYGQINLLAALAILMAWDWARRGSRPVLVGILLGLAIVLKTYPAILLLAFLVRRQATALAAAILVPVVFALASLLLLGPGIWEDWLSRVAVTASYAESPLALISPDSPFNQGFNGVFSRLLGTTSAAKLSAFAASALVVLLSAVSVWQARCSADIRYFDLAFAILTAATILVAPLSWHHHQVFVLPALLYLSGTMLARGEAVSWPLKALAIGVLVLSALPWRRYIGDHEWLAVFPFAGSLGLWALLVYKPSLEWLSAAWNRSRAVVTEHRSTAQRDPGA